MTLTFMELLQYHFYDLTVFFPFHLRILVADPERYPGGSIVFHALLAHSWRRWASRVTDFKLLPDWDEQHLSLVIQAC